MQHERLLEINWILSFAGHESFPCTRVGFCPDDGQAMLGIELRRVLWTGCSLFALVLSSSLGLLFNMAYDNSFEWIHGEGVPLFATELYYYYTAAGICVVVRIIITVPGESMSFVHWNRDHPVSQSVGLFVVLGKSIILRGNNRSQSCCSYWGGGWWWGLFYMDCGCRMDGWGGCQ